MNRDSICLQTESRFKKKKNDQNRDDVSLWGKGQKKLAGCAW